MKILLLVWTVYFAALSVCPLSMWQDIPKTNRLVQHYHTHLLQTPDLDFISFLALHYGNAPHHQQDHDAHKDLPFHHHEADCACLSVIFVPASPQQFALLSLSFPIVSPTTHYPLTATQATAHDIWQPPRA